MVTQMLCQGDAEVFKLYRQANLGMMRGAGEDAERARVESSRGAARSEPILFMFPARSRLLSGAWKAVGVAIKGVIGRTAGI